MALHCNAISHWLGAYTEWSLIMSGNPLSELALVDESAMMDDTESGQPQDTHL